MKDSLIFNCQELFKDILQKFKDQNKKFEVKKINNRSLTK